MAGVRNLTQLEAAERARLLNVTSYDINLAASDTLEAWAAALKLEFDFNDGSGSYSRSQKVAGGADRVGEDKG